MLALLVRRDYPSLRKGWFSRGGRARRIWSSSWITPDCSRYLHRGLDGGRAGRNPRRGDQQRRIYIRPRRPISIHTKRIRGEKVCFSVCGTFLSLSSTSFSWLSFCFVLNLWLYLTCSFTITMSRIKFRRLKELRQRHDLVPLQHRLV